MGVCGCEVVGGAAVPKGPMTYAHKVLGIWGSRLGYGCQGWNLGLKAIIRDSRLGN